MTLARSIRLATLLCMASAPAVAAPCPPDFSSRKSPCTPTAADKAVVLKGIEDARQAVIEARQAAASAKSMLDGAEQFSDFLEDWHSAKERAKLKQIAAQEAAGSAIQLTIKTYGLTSLFAEAEIRSGPYSSSKATPSPLLSDNRDTYYTSLGTDGREHFNGIAYDPSNTTGGYTLQDGQVVIMSQVFEIASDMGDPRLLASTLHHEGIHFRQLTSGRGWTTKEEVEGEAYNESIQTADIFELLPNEKRDLYAKRAMNQRIRPSERTPLHGAAVEAEAETGYLRQQEELARIRERESKLIARLEAGRMERARRDAALIPSPEIIADIAARNSWARAYPGLHSLAERACGKGLWGTDRESEFMMDWFAWRTAHYDDIRLDSALSSWADMSAIPGTFDCVTFVVNQVVVARRSRVPKANITPAWVAEVVSYSAAQSHPAPPTPPAAAEPPQMTIPGEIPPNVQTPPLIPHCRYHAWCKQ